MTRRSEELMNEYYDKMFGIMNRYNDPNNPGTDQEKLEEALAEIEKMRKEFTEQVDPDA